MRQSGLRKKSPWKNLKPSLEPRSVVKYKQCSRSSTDRIGVCGTSDRSSILRESARNKKSVSGVNAYMTIAICGSLTFHKEMRQVQHDLEKLGHGAYVPKSLDLIENEGFKKPVTVTERLAAEAKYNFISEHFKKIEKSDAIVVVNPDKHDIHGYIGGNTFLEMGIAFYLKKKIYVLYPLPDMEYTLELAAMRPLVLHGNLQAIG
jgi:hypothetical protein